MATSVVELLIRSADIFGGVPAIGELTKALVSSNLLSTILTGLHDAWKANLTSGPNRQHPKLDGNVETDYFNILARLSLASPQLFLSALEVTSYDNSPPENESAEQKIDWLLQEWFNHMDLIHNPANKKLNCLGLTSLLGTAQPWILSRLQSLMNEWTNVITELVIDVSLEEGVADNRDSLVYTDPEALKSEGPEAPGDERRRRLMFQDPVHRIDIRVFVREKLGIAVEACGGMEAFQREWVQNVDVDVVRGFGALGIV